MTIPSQHNLGHKIKCSNIINVLFFQFLTLGVVSLGVGVHSAFAQEKLICENRSYTPKIKTIQLYKFGPNSNSKQALQPAVTSLSQQPSLRLEFDDLSNDVSDYYARIVHCNYTWEPSTLNNLDFLGTYNEFEINDYTLSSSTYVPYIHYNFTVPSVKLAGNYMLVVYRNGDKSDIVLSHRFMIYNNLTKLSQNNPNGILNLRFINQQLQFTISYQGLEVLNPYKSIYIVIRQNKRWDNARFNIRPSAVKESSKQLEYKLFDEDKYFIAGNEFRFVDFRSINSPGQNTDYIRRSQNSLHLWVQPDKSRAHQVYAQYDDINGGYYIENLDYGEYATSSDYLHVTFKLASPAIPSSQVYITGAFNQWIQDKQSQMKYNTSSKSYEHTAVLKQGWYNYQYTIQSEQYPTYYLEGSHFETENVYEILLYHRPFSLQADVLIGYFTMYANTH